MTQLDLARLIDEDREKRGIEKRVRTAAISELYNNQRKSINKELIEEIASVLNIADIDNLIDFKEVKAPE
ncbi:XRE family transcriptional regulator [Cytobacillus horneckiae]|uniref:XRE family transcriptional regulator n=2 Tax=Cytobacillus horneckiae TaxID=549687 RepID=A0A2N0ZEC2_9BACI|nr:XRE family transcriptional regulator [Cytobacillus horneckiae]